MAVVMLAVAALASDADPSPVTGRAEAAAAPQRTAHARHAPSRTQEPSASPRTPSTSPTPSPSPSAVPDPDEAVQEALAAVDGHAGRMTLAVHDVATREFALHGGSTGTYDTASIVKVDILAALLLQAQEHGTGLTDSQRYLASDMIRSSDNDATDALWHVIGSGPGLDAANDTLGLTATTAGPYDTWGLTQTTAADQILLLEAVFGADSPLNADSRAYIQSLMSSIVPGQDWGITAASDADAGRTVKNGWLPRSTTALWDVNSIGRVEYEGRTLLVSVLTDGQPSRESGITLVEEAATAAVHSLVAALE